jgi:hypothetical protein
MSYYVVNKGNIYEAAAGLGATVRDLPFAHRDVTYRTIKDAKVHRFRSLRGLGATALEYSGAAVWSDQVACATAWQTSQTTISRCNWVNKTRAALAALGYGVLHQGVQWDSEDQAAVNEYASKNGLTSNEGLPTRDIHMLIETQLKAGIVTGDKPPVEMVETEKGGAFVDVKTTTAKASAELPGKAGLSTAQLALIGVGLVGVAAVAIALKKRGARKQITAGQAIQTPLPGAVPGTGIA